MKFKSIIRKIAVVLVVIAAIYFPFYITKPTPPSKTVIVAQGIIQDKQSYSYGCGKYGSSTCYDYTFTINNKSVLVSSDTFHNYQVGNLITLSKSIERSGWELLKAFLKASVLAICFAAVVFYILGYLVFVVSWLFFSNTKKGLIEYIKYELYG